MAKRRKSTPWDADYNGPLDREVKGHGCLRMGDGAFMCSSSYVESVFNPGDPPPLADDAYAEWSRVQIAAGLQQRRCRKCLKWRFPQELSLLRCTNKLSCLSAQSVHDGFRWAKIICCPTFSRERSKSRRDPQERKA